jgi:hypothetical protein
LNVSTFRGVLTNQIPSNAIELPARKVKLAWKKKKRNCPESPANMFLKLSSNSNRNNLSETHSFVKDWDTTLHAIY